MKIHTSPENLSYICLAEELAHLDPNLDFEVLRKMPGSVLLAMLQTLSPATNPGQVLQDIEVIIDNYRAASSRLSST